MSKLKVENRNVQKIYSTLLYLTIENPIDYRTQANAGGNPGEVGIAGRVLTELAHSGIGSVEVAW